MKPGFDYTGIFAVFICHDGRDRFLMSKRGSSTRDEQGTWEFGGGSVEFGESPEEAAKRELLEEYSCKTIYDIKPLAPFNLLRIQSEQKTHWIGFPFLIRINPDEVAINEAGSTDAVEWFKLDNLPNPLHPGTHYIFPELRNHFNLSDRF